MTHRRRHPRAAFLAAAALPVLAPGALALATDEASTAVGVAGPSSPVLVAEQVSTARQVVPFGWVAGKDGARTVLAFGRTRGVSDVDGTTAEPPSATSPGQAVLLAGSSSNDADPTAWRRGLDPLDAAGLPLTGGTWRPADGSTALPEVPTDARDTLHAGAATPGGAAALLVRIATGGGAPARSSVLVRPTDGRMRELPAPPAELVAPATSAFAGPGGRVVPMAVADAPIDDDDTSRGRTQLLLAPAGGDGVLRWDGVRWSELPWQDAAGAATGPLDVLSLQSTADGDAVALVAGDPTAPDADRLRLLRLVPRVQAFRPVALEGSRLLTGALPSGVSAIRPAAASGQPLTISVKHWWIDLRVTRDDRGTAVPVSATVHLTPPARPPAAGTTPTPPPTGETTPPTATTPEPSPTASPSTPTTPTTPEPTTPAAPSARVTGTWCTPSLSAGAGCDRALGFRLAESRGYVSAAFDAPPLDTVVPLSTSPDPSGASTPPTSTSPTPDFGERAISSPVIVSEAEETTTPREASASGGYLQLTGARFALRSGVGDDGTQDTQPATFGPGGFAVIGGARTIGRTVPRAAARAGAVEENQVGPLDFITAVALSPPDVPADERGALELGAGGSVRRQIGDRDWDFTFADTSVNRNGRVRIYSDMAWVDRKTVVLVGTDGTLATMPVPAVAAGDGSFRPSQPVLSQAGGDLDFLDVATANGLAVAVGRDGAAAVFEGTKWEAVRFGGALARANMTQVAIAGIRSPDESGPTAAIASDIGLLVARPEDDGPAIDEGLRALTRADGRGDAVRTVSMLPDGTTVVDARYVQLGFGTPWRRLAWPAEGDVVASAIWRDPAASGSTTPGPTSTTGTSPTTPGTELEPLRDLGSLRIIAAVADTGRPLFGPEREFSNGPPDQQERVRFEAQRQPRDGRLSVLGPSGWTDVARTPHARSLGADLAAWTPPVSAIEVDASGNGWAVGGSGSYSDFGFGLATQPMSFEAPIGKPPFDLRTPDQLEVPAAGSQTARRRQLLPNDAVQESGPPAQILVGGHPACLGECAGRGDQGVAADVALRDALDTAGRLSETAREGDAPAVLVIGGGRAAVPATTPGGARVGPPLTSAGADRYLEILRGAPSSAPPVVTAIGTGDARTDASRTRFAELTRALLTAQRDRPAANQQLSLVTEPLVAPIDRPDSDTVAYAIDVRRGGGVLGPRIVVIDNAGGRLRGGADGAQARWLFQVLQDAREESRPAMVVGAARLDDTPVAAVDRDDELAILGRAGAAAYVATEGPDDVRDPRFGAYTGTLGVDTAHGAPIQLYRTTGLGHGQSIVEQFVGFVSGPGDNDRDRPAYSNSALLSLRIPAATGAGAIDPSVVPLFGRVAPLRIREVTGNADFLFFSGESGSGRGMRRPVPKEAFTPFDGSPTPESTTPEPTSPTTPEPTSPTTPGPTTPEPSTPDDDTPEGTPGGPADARAYPYVDLAPNPCRFFGGDAECGSTLPLDTVVEVADPTIAVVVRARPRAKGADGPPTIVTDGDGNPVVDPASSVLCPLKAGRTSILVRTAGKTAVFPLEVSDPPPGSPRPAKKAACAFNWGRPVKKDEDKPAAPPVPPVVAPAPAGPIPEPGPAPAPAPRPPLVPQFRPPFVPPAIAGFAPRMAPAGIAPPVAPNPKPAAPPPPAPPSGVSAQQAPAQQSSVNVQSASVQQSVGITAEERRSEVAREGSDLGASALAPGSAGAAGSARPGASIKAAGGVARGSASARDTAPAPVSLGSILRGDAGRPAGARAGAGVGAGSETGSGAESRVGGGFGAGSGPREPQARVGAGSGESEGGSRAGSGQSEPRGGAPSGAGEQRGEGSGNDSRGGNEPRSGNDSRSGNEPRSGNGSRGGPEVPIYRSTSGSGPLALLGGALLAALAALGGATAGRARRRARARRRRWLQ